MLLSTAKPLESTGPKSSRVDIIEISDDEEETKAYCEALSDGNGRRKSTQGNDFVKVERDSKVSNGHEPLGLKKSFSMPVAHSPDGDGKHGVHPDTPDTIVRGIADENCSRSSLYSKQKINRHSTNATGSSSVPRSKHRCESTADSGSSHISRSSVGTMHRTDDSFPTLVGKESPRIDPLKKSTRFEGETACKTEPKESMGQGPTLAGGVSPSPKKFLKPPSPKGPLSRKEFLQMLLEDVDDLITKYGPHVIRNVNVKDIELKAIHELKPPKNLKVTPQLYKKREFMKPISADDEVIVISDDEAAADSPVPKVITKSSPESARHIRESEYQAKENFMANLQLFQRIKVKKPMKKDIANVLKTRNNMKAYIANPHVSIVKANCIYNYVTKKGILSPEQFRAQREPPRRKRKAAGKTPNPKRVAQTDNQRRLPRRRQPETPALGARRSLRKRAVRFANQPQRFTRRFFTSELKEEISRYERDHVWTSYSLPEVTCDLNVPVIVLDRLEPPSRTIDNSVSEQTVPRAATGRPKEYKCRWCPFHCLNTPSLREHCFEFHGRIYPLVMS